MAQLFFKWPQAPPEAKSSYSEVHTSIPLAEDFERYAPTCGDLPAFFVGLFDT